MIVDLVRSNDSGELGFLANTRRMNVALTRAQAVPARRRGLGDARRSSVLRGVPRAMSTRSTRTAAPGVTRPSPCGDLAGSAITGVAMKPVVPPQCVRGLARAGRVRKVRTTSPSSTTKPSPPRSTTRRASTQLDKRRAGDLQARPQRARRTCPACGGRRASRRGRRQDQRDDGHRPASLASSADDAAKANKADELEKLIDESSEKLDADETVATTT